MQEPKTYTLIGQDGKPYPGSVRGTLGGHSGRRVYGRLDCTTALAWIERGHYVRHRVFFATETDALRAGYRPCGHCMPNAYRAWKADPAAFRGGNPSG